MRETVTKVPARKRRRRRRLRPVWKLILAGAAILILLLLTLSIRACFTGNAGEDTKSAPLAVMGEANDPLMAAGPAPDGADMESISSESEDPALAETVEPETTEPETTEPETPAGRTDGLPDIDINAWQFVLINSEHTVTEKFAPKTVEIEGVSVDKRIQNALTDFIEAARAEDLPVFLNSGYRDYARQNTLYKKKCKEYSPKKAATIVAPPGTSEHQSGLAVDIIDQRRDSMDKSLEKTETYKWMKEHCAEYGFVVRYPADKKKITNIIYEPWHFRYVGVEVATYMVEHNLCLEEFVALYGEEYTFN